MEILIRTTLLFLDVLFMWVIWAIAQSGRRIPKPPERRGYHVDDHTATSGWVFAWIVTAILISVEILQRVLPYFENAARADRFPLVRITHICLSVACVISFLVLRFWVNGTKYPRCHKFFGWCFFLIATSVAGLGGFLDVANLTHR